MIIHKTYDYLSNTDRILISQDLAEVSVHSIRFDRYYTESEKQVNLQAAEMMSKEEYSAHCKGVSELYKGKMETILKEFVGKYNIHQVSEETSTMVHYHSDWDLFYGTNEVFDGENPYRTEPLQMGIDPITIDRVSRRNGSLYVEGSGFTQWSTVCVEGKPRKTTFIDKEMLRVEVDDMGDISSGDEVTVAQIGEDKFWLSQTETLFYN